MISKNNIQMMRFLRMIKMIIRRLFVMVMVAMMMLFRKNTVMMRTMTMRKMMVKLMLELGKKKRLLLERRLLPNT